MGQTRRPGPPLTPLELRIMQVLWETGPATVQIVHEKLSGERLAYTTVQTMLNVLNRKGKAKRTLRGKAYEYQPLLSQENANGQAVGDLVERLFGGSVEGLVMNLVKTHQLNPSNLKRLKTLIEEQQKGEREIQVKDD
jgi:BlaI family transcriptional regulator, penicillinase repressor